MSKLVIFRCQNCGGANKILQIKEIREIVLSCGAQLEIIHILRAFEDGALGVCVIPCDADHCKTFDGARRAMRKVKYAAKLLKETDMDDKKLIIMNYEDKKEIEAK
ncbi:MAG: hydrogenase iron-sulfur subunit, partial [bacterium]